MASLVVKMDVGAAHYHEKVLHVKQYMKEQKLPKETQVKVLWYYEHYLARKSAFDEGTILSEIAVHLRDEIIINNNKEVRKRCERSDFMLVVAS
jgi:hypothetical protein